MEAKETKPQEWHTWAGYVHPPRSSSTKRLTATEAPGAGGFVLVLGLRSGCAQLRAVWALLPAVVSLKCHVVYRKCPEISK